tara:strand:+ start:436 stop:1206 length:771 start_codon:yes stop_codon:yes gene_type:complete
MIIINKRINLNPKVSIIIVTLNSEKYLEETFQSLVNQSYKNFEVIVIDGKSSDKTLEITKKYKDLISYCISEKDDGIYDAFNKGINLSIGKFIGIVNSDDILLPNALLLLDKYDRENPNIDFIFGSVKKHWGVLYGYKPHKIHYSWGFYSSHSTGFYIKKKSAEKIGKYNTKYIYHADYDYFYRMIVHHKMQGIGTKKDELFGIFRRGGFSSRSSIRSKFLEEIRIRIDNKQNIFLVSIIFIYKFIRNFKSIILNR